MRPNIEKILEREELPGTCRRELGTRRTARGSRQLVLEICIELENYSFLVLLSFYLNPGFVMFRGNTSFKKNRYYQKRLTNSFATV
jgi:hypothetical protein